MRKTIKILSILLMLVMLMSAMNTVFATAIDPSTIEANYANQNTTAIKNMGGKILGWIRNIAAVASVVLIAILGIKFMIGSTEERAEYKKSFLPLIIGIIVVLGASAIAGWIWNIF